MEKVIEIDKNYRTVDVFEKMKVGDIYHIPYDASRSNGIKSEAARKNRDARLRNELKSEIDLKYRVFHHYKAGYTSIIRIK